MWTYTYRLAVTWWGAHGGQQEAVPECCRCPWQIGGGEERAEGRQIQDDLKQERNTLSVICSSVFGVKIVS